LGFERMRQSVPFFGYVAGNTQSARGLNPVFAAALDVAL
jgi:hypothetical protein